MIDRTTRLRWRRYVRSRRRQVEDIGSQAEEHIDRHFFRRLPRLGSVRRFVVGWIILVILLCAGLIIQITQLSAFYQTKQAVPGGTFTEGTLGTFSNVNPMYAQGTANAAVSRLVFSGLLKYNQKNVLSPDLASSWKTDEKEITYTVILREGVRWHDGKPFTADDVVFTFQTIQNPDAKSPLLTSWQNIKVEAVNTRTVKFTLPSPLSAFPNSLTTGIIPKHILKDTPVSQLRSARFNNAQPVGTGPFKWETIEVQGDTPETREERVGLIPFENFHLGSPKIQRFIVRVFRDEKNLHQSFNNQELTAISGANESTLSEADKEHDVQTYSIPVASQVAVFFKTSQPPLNDVKVRQALTHATKQSEIVSSLGYPVKISKSPLLNSHIGYDKSLIQLGADQSLSKKLLDDAGWKVGNDGKRTKDGKPLVIKLYSQNNSDCMTVTQKIQKQWHDVGVQAEVILQNDTDLQSTVANHNYDALLYGISLGTDPDVFAYWHSSQADPRLSARFNLSEYKSSEADKSLEAGRTRSDPKLRAVKYRPFLSAWRQDAPAIILYQPRFLYISHSHIFRFNPVTINEPADRFSNVHNWLIREANVSDQ